MAICDTKDTGTDYNFLGVFYQYGDRYYLEDLVFKNIDPGTLDELNSDMLVKHHVCLLYTSKLYEDYQEVCIKNSKLNATVDVLVEKISMLKAVGCHG